MLFICICPSGVFFCPISVISNRHEMTIKGFFNEKKSLLLAWFLVLLVQLGWIGKRSGALKGPLGDKVF